MSSLTKLAVALTALLIINPASVAGSRVPDPRPRGYQEIDPEMVIPRARPDQRKIYIAKLEIQNEIAIGQQLIEDGNLKDALIHFSRAVKESKHVPDLCKSARVNLSRCLSKLGRADQALHELDRVPKPRLGDSGVYNEKVKLLEDLGLYDLAVRTCDSWARNNKYDEGPLLNKAALLLKDGRRAEAGESALLAYKFCVRRSWPVKEATDLMTAAGMDIPKELPRSTEGNDFIWRTLKKMAAIRELPRTAPSQWESKDEIQKLHISLSKDHTDIIRSLGYAKEGIHKPGKEEIGIMLSQDLCIIHPIDLCHTFPNVIETNETGDFFPQIMRKEKLIRFKQDIHNGKILYSFTATSPPDLSKIYAVWTNPTKPPAELGWNEYKKTVSAALQARRYKKAADIIMDNWNTPLSADAQLDWKGILDSHSEKKAMLIAAYEGMGKQGIVDYLKAAPFSHIEHDVHQLNYYKDLPTKEEYDGHQWTARVFEDAPTRYWYINCKPYSVIDAHPKSAELREKLSSLIGTIAPGETKRIQPLPAEVVDAVDRDRRL